MASHAIAAFLSLLRPSVKVINDSKPARSACDRQARVSIAEWLRLSSRLNALKPIDLTPGHSRSPKVALQVAHHIFEQLDSHPRVRESSSSESCSLLECEREERHRFRIDAAHVIPGLQLGDGGGK